MGGIWQEQGRACTGQALNEGPGGKKMRVTFIAVLCMSVLAVATGCKNSQPTVQTATKQSGGQSEVELPRAVDARPVQIVDLVNEQPTKPEWTAPNLASVVEELRARDLIAARRAFVTLYDTWLQDLEKAGVVTEGKPGGARSSVWLSENGVAFFEYASARRAGFFALPEHPDSNDVRGAQVSQAALTELLELALERPGSPLFRFAALLSDLGVEYRARIGLELLKFAGISVLIEIHEKQASVDHYFKDLKKRVLTAPRPGHKSVYDWLETLDSAFATHLLAAVDHRKDLLQGVRSGPASGRVLGLQTMLDKMDLTTRCLCLAALTEVRDLYEILDGPRLARGVQKQAEYYVMLGGDDFHDWDLLRRLPKEESEFEVREVPVGAAETVRKLGASEGAARRIALFVDLPRE